MAMETMMEAAATANHFRISRKQRELLDDVKSRKYDLILLIGPIGSNKTFAMAYADICIAYQYPKSFIPVARTTLTEARTGTVLSYLEVLDSMGLIQGIDYKFVNGIEVRITFTHNRSVIYFSALDHTKDRDWRKVKSINATKSSIDEIDSVKMMGYVNLSSRNGRRNQNGQPAVTTATCNPNDGWVKEHIYNKWKNPAKYGKLPDRIKVIEFNMEDSFLYKTGYYDRFMTNPEQWKQRYLYNNWDYQDDENSLFKMRILDNIHRDDFDSTATGYQGTDVAREGKDRSVIAVIKGNTLVDIQIRTKEDLDALAEPHEKEAPPYTDILARESIKIAGVYSIGYQHASGDAVGNGAGFIDACRMRGFKLNEFKAGARPIEATTIRDPDILTRPDIQQRQIASQAYNNLRSQMYHQLAMDMQKGEFFFWNGCPHLAELKQELLYHGADQSAKVLEVESKDSIRERLGKSPDLADAVVMAFYNKKSIVDKRYNKNRIG